MELRIVRLVATLGFFTVVTLAVVNLAGAWGYVVGSVLFGFMVWVFWRDELNARANEHEQEAAAKIRRQQTDQMQEMPMFPASPNPAPPPTQALPPGPSAPIQHSGG